MKKNCIKCPAKLNLFLNIINKRKDGYHNLYLINETVSLFDELEIVKSCKKGIKIWCNNKNIPINEKNSVYKMAKLFFEYNKIEDYNINIKIKKCIPLCSGMGGESTDAAGTLILLDKIYNTNLSLKEKISLASKVGSDVPYFLIGGRCKVLGKGNKIKKIKRDNSYNYVVIKPEFDSSTKEMFSKIIKYKKVKLTIGHNDFEFLMFDQIKDIKNDIVKYNPSFSMMTGSGSSVYGAFLNDYDALKCYNELKEKYNNIFLLNEVN